jgi:hypothetical protein
MLTLRFLSVSIGFVLLATPSPQAAEPQLVQPDVISTARNETFPSVDPADGSLWFSVYHDNFDRQTILRAPKNGATWGAPAAVPFSTGTFGDRAPRFSVDGKRLYFSSSRPTTADGRGGLFHLWVMERRGSSWGEATALSEPVNSAAADRHSSETRNGDLFFSSTRTGGAGRSDLYHAKRTGARWVVEPLPPSINDALSQPDVLVAPDGSWMLLVITDHKDGLGGDDLFLSRRAGGSWSRPEHLPAPINSKEYEYGPSLSPDGRTLYFTSHRRGSADVYRVPVSSFLKK